MFAFPVTGPEQCSTCRFFDTTPERLREHDDGECRRYPPMLFEHQVLADEDEEAAAKEIVLDRFQYAHETWCWLWPTVHRGSVCGEYRRATAK